MQNKPLLLKTLNGEYTERPPVWYMRQAGRVLPSYMAMREKYSFWQMMQDPALGAEVTLWPIKELGVDAAILFSDILVIPYAMGMGLEFTDQGPVFDTPLYEKKSAISVINPDESKLHYIYKVIDKIVQTKPDDIPLIGFCGGPFTVLCYMLEGLSSKDGFPEAIKYMYQHKQEVKALVKEIESLSLRYLKGQVKHGISVFQLFETHAGLIPFELYKELFLPMVKNLAAEARNLNVPFIYFPKDIGLGLKEITPDYCDYISVESQTPLTEARTLIPHDIGLQGNIDPRMLYMNEDEIEKELKKYIEFGNQNQDWIINLGHGFKPGIEFEKIKFMTDYLKNANWTRQYNSIKFRL